MPQPLQGCRVVDFTHVLSGPIATNFLRLLGAEVIKIESAAGDTMRNYGGIQYADGMGPSFASVNSGKKSIVLDLKHDADVAVARELIAGADVVTENFRPGVMDRLGLGYRPARPSTRASSSARSRATDSAARSATSPRSTRSSRAPRA